LEGAGAKPGYARHWSRVWSWPIPPDTYVDPEVVCACLDGEASHGAPVDPTEVRAYFKKENPAEAARLRR
jgi:hypothetical protein